MNRTDFKELLLSKRIHQYEVARQIGISEFTLSRWLRSPSMEQEKKISEAIESLLRGDVP